MKRSETHFKKLNLGKGTLFSIVILVGLNALSINASAAPVVIDFEDLNNGDLVLQQYDDKGITFNSPRVFDYPQESAAWYQGFAHSGTKAIEQCYGIEFCTTPIVMKFTAAQKRVKVWVGYSTKLVNQKTVILSTFDVNGALVGQTTATFQPSTVPIPIQTSLEVLSDNTNIYSATVKFAPDPNFPNQYPPGGTTNHLAVDNVEFDTAGPAPPCESGDKPILSVTEPTSGQIVHANKFNLRGTVTTDSPLEKATLTVTGSNGSNSINLLDPILKTGLSSSQNGGDFSLAGIQDMLFPGSNTVTILAQNCRGASQSEITINFNPISNTGRIKVTGMTFKQDILDENGVPTENNFPIANVHTIVKVYLKAEGSTYINNISGSIFASPSKNPNNYPPVLDYNLKPYNLKSMNVVTVESALNPQTPDMVVRRGENIDTLNFELPQEWTKGSLHFDIKLDSEEGPIDCDGCDPLDNQGFPIIIKFEEPVPLNLYWDRVDLNGIPLNPKWGWQLERKPDDPDYYPKIMDILHGDRDVQNIKLYTDQISDTDNGHWCGPHVNYFPVTFEGFLKWSGKSTEGSDDDYNLYFFPPEGVGAYYQSDNVGGIMTEFDSDETIDKFSTPWWLVFKDASDDQKHHTIDKKYSIVTALWGLDCAWHPGGANCQPELHPVWAMATLTDESPNYPYDDRWTFFARNWGNEGYCGTNQHNIDYPQLSSPDRTQDNYVYRFKIPWKPGAISVEYKFEPNGVNPDGSTGLSMEWFDGPDPNNAYLWPPPYSIKPIPNDGVILSFEMTHWSKHPFIDGHLILEWKFPPSAQPSLYPFNYNLPKGLLSATGFKESEEEEIYQKMLESVPPEKRGFFEQKYKEIMTPQISKTKTSILTDMVTREIVTREIPEILSPISKVENSVDEEKLNRDKLFENEMQKANIKIFIANPMAGDLNDNEISVDAGDLVLMRRASIGEIQADSRYDLNNNGQNADAGDLVLMKRASIGEINLQ